MGFKANLLPSFAAVDVTQSFKNGLPKKKKKKINFGNKTFL